MSTLALIGLGSNLGDRKASLDLAVAALAETPGVVVTAVSPYHETAPIGGPSGQGAFLNAAAALESTLEPERLLDRLNAIENQAGRVRSVRWGERTLDLDLLLFGDRVIQTPRLQVPHPRLALRRFVLAPLAEIAPDAVVPMSRCTVKELVANLDRRPGYISICCGRNPESFAAVMERLQLTLDAVTVHDPAGRENNRRLLPWAGQDDPDQILTRRASLLGEEAWSDLGDRWLLSDFDLSDSILDADAWWGQADPRRYFAHLQLWLEFKAKTIRPTFAVWPALPARSGSVTMPRPCHDWPPVLQLDRNDPEAATDEILAACAATRAG